MYHCIIVEGIPGAGKTCFAEKLSKQLGDSTLFLTEPDDVGNTNPYLSNYYEDPHKYAFVMQIHLLQTRYRYHKMAQYHALSHIGHSVVDRSYYGDVGFAYVQKQLGFFSEDEYKTYESLFNIMSSNILYPSMCIYINVNLETAMHRIKKRMNGRAGRECENGVCMDYLDRVNKSVGVAIDRLKQFGTKLMVVDWNKEMTENEIDNRIEIIANDVKNYKSNLDFCDIYNRLV